MPWRPSDARRHTKKATSHEDQVVWSEIANRLLAEGASEGSAIRQANAVIKKRHQKKRRKRRRKRHR